MTTPDELEALRKHGLKLRKEMRSVNRELKRALHAVAAGRLGRSMQVLENRFEDYADLKFELGRVTGEIRYLRMHLQEQEQERRGWDADRPEADWQEHALAEDRLSWLGLDEPTPDAARAERQPQHEREERAVEDMQREREPEDDRDWWKR